MEVKVFDNGDDPFLKWMDEHPKGYVLNVKRVHSSAFAVFHNSQCPHISGVLLSHRRDGHTKHDKIKVCAMETKPLVEWLVDNRPKAVGGAEVCGDCELKIESPGFTQRQGETGEHEPHGANDAEKTSQKASQATEIQTMDFISRVEELNGETLLTKTGSEYSVHLNDGKVVFTLLSERSSEGGRPLPERELRKVLKQFNETGSLSTGDYRELTVNASYILPILKRMRQEEEDYVPRRARDLDEPEQPNRVRREVLRVVRDSTHSQAVKVENDYECQICGETLRLANGERYAEAHHVRPLGQLGKDIPANIMCVCPNHHALLDYGAIPLDSEDIDGVGSRYIAYHNSQIFGSGQEN